MAIDSAARNPEFQRLIRLQTEAFARSTPYHSLELNDGQVIPGLIGLPELRARLDAYGLPADLRGKRVLDVGAASGWNSFECERRGAEVVAIDYVEYEELTWTRQLRNSKVEYVVIDLEELSPERFGYFDYVLFFGVLYHLRHPLLGLEKVCAVTRDTALIESYAIDDSPSAERCHMEFYETDELGGQIDNWCGPTTQCLMAMTRAAGFAQVQFLYAHSRRCGLIAKRRWEAMNPAATGEAPFLCSAVNNRHQDSIFQQGKDEYVVLSFLLDAAVSTRARLSRDDIRVELDGYGVPSLFVAKHQAGHWQVNCKLPPGLAVGEHKVRIAVAGSAYSEAIDVRVLPSGADRRFGEVAFVPEAPCVAPPVLLLCENTLDGSRVFRGYRSEKLICQFTQVDGPLDLSRVQLTIDENFYPLLSVERPKPGVWQVNAKLKGLTRGVHCLRIRTARSDFSQPMEIEFDPVSFSSTVQSA